MHYKSLSIKASAKCINVNVIRQCSRIGGWGYTGSDEESVGGAEQAVM